jgi:hypothetical protein
LKCCRKAGYFYIGLELADRSTEYKELFSKLRIIGSNLQLIGLILPEKSSIISYEFTITKINYLYKVTVSMVVWLGKKVNVTLVQALRLCTGRAAHRGSRGIALLYRH